MHFQLVAYIKNSQFILSRKFGGCSHMVKPYRVVSEEHQQWSEHHQPNKMYCIVWSFQTDVRYFITPAIYFAAYIDSRLVL